MPHTKKIQDILNNTLNKIGLDIVPINPENSMLDAKTTQTVLSIYRDKLLPAYGKKFAELGEADGVLKQLENYIVQRINSIVPHEKNQTALSPGELAAASLENRLEFKGELGKYHTALRALLDKNHTIQWPSLLHKGSDEFFLDENNNKIYFRDLLALFYLSACDEQMEINEQFLKDNNTPEFRKTLIEGSIEEFISMLAFIRRAHNEGPLEDIALDNPSCGPGTFGRITTRSSIYNKLTALPTASVDLVPQIVRAYVIDTLKNASNEIKTAIFNYINRNLMYLDVQQKDIEGLETFTTGLWNSKLNTHIKKLFSNPDFKISTLYAQAILDCAFEILSVEISQLKLEKESYPDSNFINTVLSICSEGLQHHLLHNALSIELVKQQLQLRNIAHFLNVLERMIDNENVRSLLSPEYVKSEKYVSKRKQYAIIVKEYQTVMTKLKEALNQTVQNKIPSVEKTIAEEAPQHAKIQEANVIAWVNISTGNFYSKIESNLQQIHTKLSHETVDVSKLPTLEFQTVVPNGNSALYWSSNILRIGTETEKDKKQLIKDTRELERLFELLSKRDKEFQKSVEQKLINLIQYITFEKKPEIIDFIAKIFTNFDLKEAYPITLTLNSIASSIAQSGYSNEKISELHAVAKTQLYRDDNFNQAAYDKWKQTVHEILANNFVTSYNPTSVRLVKDFVLLTVFNNLQIVNILEDDAKTIEWYCDIHLEILTTAEEIIFNEEPANGEKEIQVNNLSGHISTILTVLQSASTLFNAGCVRLMSRTKAELTLKNAKDLGINNPYMLRFGNSNPTLVLSQIPDKMEHRLFNRFLIAKITIEDVTFEFYSFLPELIAFIKNAKLTNLICALVSFEKATGKLYSDQVKVGYENISKNFISQTPLARDTIKLLNRVGYENRPERFANQAMFQDLENHEKQNLSLEDFYKTSLLMSKISEINSSTLASSKARLALETSQFSDEWFSKLSTHFADICTTYHCAKKVTGSSAIFFTSNHHRDNLQFIKLLQEYVMDLIKASLPIVTKSDLNNQKRFLELIKWHDNTGILDYEFINSNNNNNVSSCRLEVEKLIKSYFGIDLINGKELTGLESKMEIN